MDEILIGILAIWLIIVVIVARCKRKPASVIVIEPPVVPVTNGEEHTCEELGGYMDNGECKPVPECPLHYQVWSAELGKCVDRYWTGEEPEEKPIVIGGPDTYTPLNLPQTETRQRKRRWLGRFL